MSVNWDDIQEVNGGTDSTWDAKSPLIGTYVGAESGVGPNESMMYHVKTDDGKVVGVWGSTVLDTKFGKVEKGSLIRVESLGLKKNPKTAREFKDFSLKVKPTTVEDIFPGSSEV